MKKFVKLMVVVMVLAGTVAHARMYIPPYVGEHAREFLQFSSKVGLLYAPSTQKGKMCRSLGEATYDAAAAQSPEFAKNYSKKNMYVVAFDASKTLTIDTFESALEADGYQLVSGPTISGTTVIGIFGNFQTNNLIQMLILVDSHVGCTMWYPAVRK